jgi:L,D-transpeptidase-like protein
MFPRLPAVGFALLVSLLSARADLLDLSNRVIISVRDQKLMVLQNGARAAIYPVSTSKFGLGDDWGRLTTPLGFFQVAQKIGDHAPVGAVFHNRHWTGEILSPNTPGRDPVITRIIWLRGLEWQNAHAFSRCIYIHGTPEEKLIGRPASYGCIRMKSNDITTLYNELAPGALVQIVSDRLPKVPKARPVPARNALIADDGTKSQEQLGSKPTSDSLTVEQMRIAGALAAERQRDQAQARLEQMSTARVTGSHPTNKAIPARNKGTATAQNSPRA